MLKQDKVLDKVLTMSQDINELKAQAEVFTKQAKELEEKRKKYVTESLNKLNEKSIENDLIKITLQNDRANYSYNVEELPEEYTQIVTVADEDKIKKEIKEKVKEAQLLDEEYIVDIPGVSISYTPLAPKITLRTKESA